MNLDHVILRLLTSREGYDSIREYIKIESFEPGVKKVVQVIDKLYRGGVDAIKLSDLTILIPNEYPSMKEHDWNLIQGLLTHVYNTDVDGTTIKEVIKNYRCKQMAAQLVMLGTEGIDNPGKFDIDKLKKICDDYDRTEVEEEDTTRKTFDLDQLLESESSTSGYTAPWEDMDKIAGRFKGGMLLLVFGTPDTGKSAFCHTLATHLASQCKVLFINNEERAKKVYLRAMCCWTEMTKDEAVRDRVEFNRRWDQIKDNYIYRDDSNLTIKSLKRYIEKDKPDVVFIDQATKIKIKDTGRHDLTLTTIFKELREVVKEFGIDIVGVSQADSNAYGVEWLQMKHLANVKIGVQGELDTMIGLSRPKDGQYVNVSFPKVKETGRSSDKMVLELNKQISRMLEVN